MTSYLGKAIVWFDHTGAASLLGKTIKQGKVQREKEPLVEGENLQKKWRDSGRINLEQISPCYPPL